MSEVGLPEPLTESPVLPSDVSTVEGDLYGECAPETPADPGPVSLPEPVSYPSQESTSFSVPGVFKYDPASLDVCADTSTPEGIALALEQTQSPDPKQRAAGLESLEATPSLDACFLPTEENKLYILAQTVSQDPLRNAVGWKTARAAGIEKEAAKLVTTIAKNFLTGPEGEVQAKRFVAGIKDPEVREEARSVVASHAPAEERFAKENAERMVLRKAEVTRDCAERDFSMGRDPEPALTAAAYPADDHLAIPVESSNLHAATTVFPQSSFTPLLDIQRPGSQEPEIVVFNEIQPIGSIVLETHSPREGNRGVTDALIMAGLDLPHSNSAEENAIPDIVVSVSEEDPPEKIMEKKKGSPGIFMVEAEEEVDQDGDNARYAADDAESPRYAPVPPQLFVGPNPKDVAATAAGVTVVTNRTDPQKRATPVSDHSNPSDHRGEDRQFAHSGRGGRGGRGKREDDDGERPKQEEQYPSEENA
jgi:hypothetical protein